MSAVATAAGGGGGDSQAQSVFCGVDMGSSKTVVSIATGSQAKGATLVRNNLANDSTATLVAFTPFQRFVGEEAAEQRRRYPKDTVSDIPRLVGASKAEYESISNDTPFTVVEGLDGPESPCQVAVMYRGETITIPVESVMATLLQQLLGFVRQSLQSTEDPGCVSIAIPPYYSSRQRRAVLDACRLAGVPEGNVRLVTSLSAAAASYGMKHHNSLPGGADAPADGPESRTVAIVDIGEQVASAGLFKYSASGVECICVKSTPTLGASAVDAAIFDILARHCNERHSVVLKRDSRAGGRAAAECIKAKKVLSTVPTTVVDLENVPCPDGVDRDIRVSVSASDVELACAGMKRELSELLQTLATECGGADAIHSIELIGGGTRIPWVKAAVSEVLGDKLSHTLDSASAVSVGAAVLASWEGPLAEAASSSAPTSVPAAKASEAEGTPSDAADQTNPSPKPEEEAPEESEPAEEAPESSSPPPTTASAGAGGAVDPPSPASTSVSFLPSTPFVQPPSSESEGSRLSAEAFTAAASLQERFAEEDRLLRDEAAARNQVEAYIFQMREAMSGPLASKLDSEKLTADLTAAEDWLWEQPDSQGTQEAIDRYTTKLEELTTSIKGHSEAFFAAQEAEKKRVEEDLAASAAVAAAAKAAEGEEDDHDTRKLKKSDRMRLVMKNKDEGNELFRHGNLQHAVLRYTKALTHASKFFDLDDEGKAEVDAVKLSVYNNLAQCYIKLEMWSKAGFNAESALKIDPSNMKALYRRAFAAMQLKEYDEAEAALKTAASVNADDKPCQKLQQRLTLIREKQKAKERAMARKMFG